MINLKIKHFQLLVLTFIQNLQVFTRSDQLPVRFFNGPNYNNPYWDFNAGKCKNLQDINNRISAVKTKVCIRLFDDFDCTGTSHKIHPPGHRDFRRFHFDNMLSSFSDCDDSSTGGGGGRKEMPTIHVNTEDVPELENFGHYVKDVLMNWFPVIENQLRTPAYKPVTKIKVYFDPNYEGLAETTDGTITAGGNYFIENHRDGGAFIHELTHVIQQSRGCPDWLVEGFADWTRKWLYEPWLAQEKPTKDQSYRDGFTTTAWLLAYVNVRIGERRVPVLYNLNKACQEGKWYDGIWYNLTGSTVDELWQEMIDNKNYPWKK